MNWYLKYEKILYELDEKQAVAMRAQIERGGRISIQGQMLMAGKCELINELPYNRDEYEIKPIYRPQLPTSQTHIEDTEEDYKRKSGLLASMRKDLAEKLNWANK